MIQTEWNDPHNGAMDYEEYARDAIGILRQNGSDTHADALSRLLVRVVSLEAALAEARKDRERLEWAWACPESFTMAQLTCPPNRTGRQAIDAARGAK